MNNYTLSRVIRGMKLLGLLAVGINARLPKWSWDSIAAQGYPMEFPADFTFGISGSDYQWSGGDNICQSNWASWEKVHAGGRIKEPSGDACGFYETYVQDINLLQELGCTAFRVSVEWAALEPERGVIDHAALERYITMFKALRAAGIQVMVTLHHFVHPQWFEELGAFQKAENIAYFVDFCRFAFSNFHPYVDVWCTFNEPTIYTLSGYIRGAFPPGYRFNFARASTVLYHLLCAHTRVYHALKAMPGGQRSQIGIVHQWLQFVPFHEKGVYAYVEKKVVDMLNQILHEALMGYFLHGVYRCQVNTSALSAWLPQSHFHVNMELPGDCGSSLDFFGINYYSKVPLRLQHDYVGEGYYEGDIRTDMPYAFYPEGLYEALMHARAFNVPIYITENGIADAQDDRRALWIRQHLYAVSQAIRDGAPVKGFWYWSLLDNFEWDMGYPLKFGLYHVDRVSKKRTLRPGSLAYTMAIADHKLRHARM